MINIVLSVDDGIICMGNVFKRHFQWYMNSIVFNNWSECLGVLKGGLTRRQTWKWVVFRLDGKIDTDRSQDILPIVFPENFTGRSEKHDFYIPPLSHNIVYIPHQTLFSRGSCANFAICSENEVQQMI